MCAHHVAQKQAPSASTAAWLTWLGGGERGELRERHERSAHAVTGLIVLTNVALSWCATTLAVWPALHRWAPAVLPVTLIFAVLVGVTGRAVAAGPAGGNSPRGAAAVAVVLMLVLGGVAGECAALALLSGPVDRLLRQEAAGDSLSAPAVAVQSTKLRGTREARIALDHAVDAARAQRDEALVIARCEYHPTPACPQTRITGVAGSGPETRTANQLLADSQREVDQAVAARDLRAPVLDAQIRDGERALDQIGQNATRDVDQGVGARWVAMQNLTFGNAGMLSLRLLVVGFFVFLGLLPPILRQWRGDTSQHRDLRARLDREHAELMADTAIAVKRAEVRAAAKIAWAEQQLAQARLAVQAQTEIDRAKLRQRVNAAIEVSTPDPGPVDDIYLPIAAEAHAASLVAPPTVDVVEADNLPATTEPSDPPATQTIPNLPDVTRAAARWIRPLVPGFVSRAIDTSTHPLRTARQVIEDVEHITFSLKRTRRLSVEVQEGVGPSPTPRPAASRWPDEHDDADLTAASAIGRATAADDRSLGRREPGELRASDGPRQLPPVG